MQAKKGTLLEIYHHRTEENTIVAAIRNQEQNILHALVEFRNG